MVLGQAFVGHVEVWVDAWCHVQCTCTYTCICAIYWQESVSVWLSVLRMSQYEQTMLEAGYDDIDFVCDITVDDLQDIGISKRGELLMFLGLKRGMQ